MKKIYLSSPHMSENDYEKKFVDEAFDTNWISSVGNNINMFENELKNYLNINNATALASGTAALHLTYKAAGIKKGDIVFCQDLTFSATVNPLIYEGAIPVFIDSEMETWNIDPEALKVAFDKYGKPKAIVVVDLYGNSPKMEEILKICKENNITLIEDSAEALGSKYNDKYLGTFGEYGIFSFNGNKIITTSAGGAVVSNNIDKIEKIKFWATQSKEAERYYEHKEIGYNYRMSNVLAGIGRGQLKVLEERIKQKTKIYFNYNKAFENISDIKMQPYLENSKSNFWLSCILLDNDSKIKPLDIILALEKENIEARHIWKPMHLQPIFKKYDFISTKINENNSEYIFKNGVCLPSDTNMTEEDQNRVIEIIKKLWKVKK